MVLVLAVVAPAAEWKVEGGMTVGEPIPYAMHCALHRDDWGLRVATGYFWTQELTWWTGTHVGVEYALAHAKWFAFDIGIGGSYYYAQAADSLAMTVNRLTGKHVMYEAQWVEWAGVGPEASLWLHGLDAQVTWPGLPTRALHRDWEWRYGYSWYF